MMEQERLDLANGLRVEWCDEHNAPQWRDDKCYTVVAIDARFNTCRIVTRLVFDLPAEKVG